MLGILACLLPSRRGMLSACSKPVACVASQTSLETPTGETTSVIFFVTLLPLLRQCGRPFDPRLAYPGSFRTSNGMKVPEALDIISIDM